MAPWYERNNQIQTIVPGQQSVVYPDAPTGLVFPSDPGVARGLSPAQLGNISPRLGIAYSPNDKTSIRASYGVLLHRVSRACRPASCTACRRTATTT